jgi:hypothetical protein
MMGRDRDLHTGVPTSRQDPVTSRCASDLQPPLLSFIRE